MRGYWHNPFSQTRGSMMPDGPTIDVQDIVGRALAILEPESARFGDECRRRAAERARVRDRATGESEPSGPSVSRNDN